MRQCKSLCFHFSGLNLQNPNVQIWILVMLDLTVLHERFLWGICKQQGSTETCPYGLSNEPCNRAGNGGFSQTIADTELNLSVDLRHCQHGEANKITQSSPVLKVQNFKLQQKCHISHKWHIMPDYPLFSLLQLVNKF